MGGDEFLVLLLGERGMDCAEAAERLQGKAAEEAVIPFSLGWAVREEGERLEQTIDRADHKLLHIRVRERRFRRRRVGQG
jgi:GGDEF domain-containing protein